jgi:hypothetical protein
VAVVVTGDAGGAWYVERVGDGWRQAPAPPRPPASTVTMSPETCWRLVTKRRPPGGARRLFPDVRVEGEAAFGEPALGTVAMMA